MPLRKEACRVTRLLASRFTYTPQWDITKNPVLMQMYAEQEAKVRAETLQELLEIKFGALPRWAVARIAKSSPAQVDRWVKKILDAETLEGVLGARHRNGS